MSDGETLIFVVDEVRQAPTGDLSTGDLTTRDPSTGDLFRRVGPHQMARSTCGGAVDASSRHHRDNLVVIAGAVV
jgi:hypothetical protein